jgi:hypothetical protein
METVKSFKKPNENAFLRPVLASFLVSAPIPKNLETRHDSNPTEPSRCGHKCSSGIAKTGYPIESPHGKTETAYWWSET